MWPLSEAQYTREVPSSRGDRVGVQSVPVPELPEVETVRRALEPVFRGVRIDLVTLRRQNLRRPFPPDFARRLQGITVQALSRRGKYLLAELSSGETLVMHLGMSGEFRVHEAGSDPERHDHVVFALSSGARISFNDARRFGVMDLLPNAELNERPPLSAIGPEPLSAGFTADVLARSCARRRTPIKVVLLDQTVVAGLGNIYASEALSLARVSPRLAAAKLATSTGQPRPAARRLVAAIKAVLHRAIARQSGRRYRGAAFRVYDREGERCPNNGCPGTVRRITQAGRSTYFCPKCQRSGVKST